MSRSTTTTVDAERPVCSCHNVPMYGTGRRNGHQRWGCAVAHKARFKAWKKAHPDYHSAYWRRWAAAHSDRTAAGNKRFRESHRRERAEAERTRRAQKKNGMIGDLTLAQVEAVFLEYGGRCVYCGALATTQDHDMPLARGGRHSRLNIVPACVACNSGKRARTGSEWVLVMLPRLVAAT